MTILLLAVLWFLTPQAVAATAPAAQATPAVVVLETEAGNITLEIDTAHAPITSANFLKYVDAGLYDGSRFFRTVRPDTETRKDVPIDVIVADLDPARASERFPPIPLERTSVTGLKNVDGAITMGRLREADSAQTEFFICIGDQPLLDFGGKRHPDGQGFAVFGKVIAGMEVVKTIWMSPADARQRLIAPVKIIRAHRK